jgi:hypothetical protein
VKASYPIKRDDERRREHEEAERRRHEYQVVHELTKIREVNLREVGPARSATSETLWFDQGVEKVCEQSHRKQTRQPNHRVSTHG